MPLGAAKHSSSQWLRPEILSLLLLISVAAFKTVITKAVLTRMPTPIAYSLLSSVITGLLVAAPALWYAPETSGSCGGVKLVALRDLSMLAFVAIAVAIDLGLSNVAISLLALPLQQAIASAIPAATILLESIVFRRLKPCGHYFAILLLCSGAVIGHLYQRTKQRGDEEKQSDTAAGELAMLFAIFAAATKYVFAKASLIEWKRQMGPLGLLLWIEVLITFVLLPWALLNGELASLVALVQHSQNRLATLATLCGCAALGGFRFFCELYVLKFWSATTLSAINLIAHSVIIIVSIVASRLMPTPSLIAGTLLTMMGAWFYAWLKLNAESSQISSAVIEELHKQRMASDSCVGAAVASAWGQGGRSLANKSGKPKTEDGITTSVGHGGVGSVIHIGGGGSCLL